MTEWIVLLDSDGVLSDFVSAAIKAHGHDATHESVTSWNFYEGWGLNDEQFWSKCKGKEFWQSIEPYPWATEFYSRLAKMFDVYICTAPAEDDECFAGKLDWYKRVLGVGMNRVVFARNKWLLANPLRLLIDDSPKNVSEFQNNSGMSIGFKQPWNRFTSSWEDVLEQVAPLSSR